MFKKKIFIRYLGIQPYEVTLYAMREFTSQRKDTTIDEIWLVEHLPVFTIGHTSKTEHSMIPVNIPVIKSDRGGQTTYHGPGQQIMYILFNLKRRKISVSKLILLLEQTVINTLLEFNIKSYLRNDAPGVYVNDMKICSLGLHISKGCSSHGLALNVDMDMSPFLYINPCGHVGIKMTQMLHWVNYVTLDIVKFYLVQHFLALINNPPYTIR